MEAGIKSNGRRAETLARAKLGELGHLHTPPLYPTSASASLSDLEEISPENGKGGNKACPREVELLSHAAQRRVQIKHSSLNFTGFIIFECGSQVAGKSSPAPRLKDQRDQVNNSSFKFDFTHRLLNRGTENR